MKKYQIFVKVKSINGQTRSHSWWSAVDASLNNFLDNWYAWVPMGATENWLVFEPNYRGSTGYGDRFFNINH